MTPLSLPSRFRHRNSNVAGAPACDHRTRVPAAISGAAPSTAGRAASPWMHEIRSRASHQCDPGDLPGVDAIDYRVPRLSSRVRRRCIATTSPPARRGGRSPGYCERGNSRAPASASKVVARLRASPALQTSRFRCAWSRYRSAARPREFERAVQPGQPGCGREHSGLDAQASHVLSFTRTRETALHRSQHDRTRSPSTAIFRRRA